MTGKKQQFHLKCINDVKFGVNTGDIIVSLLLVEFFSNDDGAILLQCYFEYLETLIYEIINILAYENVARCV